MLVKFISFRANPWENNIDEIAIWPINLDQGVNPFKSSVRPIKNITKEPIIISEIWLILKNKYSRKGVKKYAKIKEKIKEKIKPKIMVIPPILAFG